MTIFRISRYIRIATDGEPVEPPGEVRGQNDVGWNLAHHVDLQAVVSPPQPIGRDGLQNEAGFSGCAAERHHDDHVGEANSFPYVFQGPAFEGESVFVSVMVSLVRQAVSFLPPTAHDRQQQDSSSQRDGI
jgi:hypothetical protein